MTRLALAALLGSLLGLSLAGCTTVPPQATTVRVLTWNIHHGAGLDDRIDVERLADLIRTTDADLVALQEVDRGVLRSGHLDLASELATRLGMTAVFGKNIDYQGGDYGNAVLSRLPVRTSDNFHYEMLREGEQRGLLTVVVQTSVGPLRFCSTHIDYRGDDEERLAHTRAMVARLGHQDRPRTILCGDFNDRPGSRAHAVMTAAFVDAWDAVGEGEGPTYPADTPDRRIDWILSAGAGITLISASVIPTLASDHRPVLAVFRLAD